MLAGFLYRTIPHLTMCTSMRLIVVSLAILVLSGCADKKRHFVISKIKSTAQLATTETTIDKVVIGTKERRAFGLIKLGQAEFVAYTEATVKTGIDLTELRPEDVVIQRRRIEVTLPPIKVIDFAYPFDKYRVDKDITDNDFFVGMTIYDHEELFRRAELDIRENLQFMGIVEQTKANTTRLMEGLLKNLGYEEIYIDFREGPLIQTVDVTQFQPDAEED